MSVQSNMKLYPIYKLSENEYGEHTEETYFKDSLVSIYLQSQEKNNIITLSDSVYIGLTTDKEIDESCVIHYGDKKLKVALKNPFGRLIQLSMDLL